MSARGTQDRDTAGNVVGNVVGNVYDKYGTRNPIARAMMREFLATVTGLFNTCGAQTVLEVGCGEGKLATHLMEHAVNPPGRFVASDISLAEVGARDDTPIEFVEASIYDLPFETSSFDLVLCCEVLEHLDRPRDGMAELARVSARHVILSTPWEPVWRILNVARGKYLSALGNTPGHLQHFSRRALIDLASSHLEVRQVRRPLPWTVILGSTDR